MLPPWLIEQIKQEEEKKKQEQQRPQLPIPTPDDKPKENK
jgi:hypothetical protein